MAKRSSRTPARKDVPQTGAILDSLDVRLGLGLLRLSTEGRPSDLDAVAVIHFALNQGIRLLDTADSYAIDSDDAHYGEHLIRQALESWRGARDDVKVSTKVGLTRTNARWIPNGRPAHLRAAVEGSLKALGVDRLFLLQLHARDPNTPFEETLATLAELQHAGKVEHLGLCNVSVDEVRQAQRHFSVAAIQNELSVIHRSAAADGTLALADELGIPFLAHRPLGGHAKVAQLKQHPVLKSLGERHGATPAELALAALRDVSRHIIPLVGATRIASIKSSLKSLGITPDDSDRTALSVAFPFPTVAKTPSVELAFRSSGEVPSGPSATPEVILLMGIQGAGKSEMVAQYVSAGYSRLNRDELGGNLDDLIPHLRQHLSAGRRRIVLDNTYPTRSSRAPVVTAAREYGIPIRCRHLDTPLAEAQFNIALRMVAKYGVPLGPDEMKMLRKADPTLPPPQALHKWLAGFEPPAVDEGFASVERIPFVRRIDSQYSSKGLLLDVDGTLRKTISGEIYPRHPDDVELLPRRREVLSGWVAEGYQLFFVSNQSGVASGKVSHPMAQQAFFRTATLLGLPVAEIAYCPHPHQPVGCFCRKPMPGLGAYLIHRHQLSREHLVMVGDMESDAQFAAAIGARFVLADEFFTG
jgi:HAD superfamily hydrolase (TIGR01662 family)